MGCNSLHCCKNVCMHILAASSVRESMRAFLTLSSEPPTMCICPLSAGGHQKRCNSGGKRNQINHCRLLHTPHRLPTVSRESDLPHTIHHSNKRDHFHSLAATIPHTYVQYFRNHQQYVSTLKASTFDFPISLLRPLYIRYVIPL